MTLSLHRCLCCPIIPVRSKKVHFLTHGPNSRQCTPSCTHVAVSGCLCHRIYDEYGNSEWMVLLAGTNRSTEAAHQEEPSGSFSARALRRSGWQPPPPHRSNLGHSHAHEAPRGHTLPDHDSTSSHHTEETQPRHRHRSAQHVAHDTSGWNSKTSPSTFTRSITGGQMHMHGGHAWRGEQLQGATGSRQEPDHREAEMGGSVYDKAAQKSRSAAANRQSSMQEW